MVSQQISTRTFLDPNLQTRHKPMQLEIQSQQFKLYSQKKLGPIISSKASSDFNRFINNSNPSSNRAITSQVS